MNFQLLSFACHRKTVSVVLSSDLALFQTLLADEVLSSPGVSQPTVSSSRHRRRFRSPSSFFHRVVLSLEYYRFLMSLSILSHLCPSLPKRCPPTCSPTQEALRFCFLTKQTLYISGFKFSLISDTLFSLFTKYGTQPLRPDDLPPYKMALIFEGSSCLREQETV